MADFDSFTDVTTLQTTDKLLLLRSGGGINVTLDYLFRNAPGTIITGLGVSTGAAGIELGGLRSGDGNAYLDFHAISGGDFESRVIRSGGVNGAMDIIQTGTGLMKLSAQSGDFAIDTGGARRVHVTAGGLTGIGLTSPQAILDLYGAANLARPTLQLRGGTKDIGVPSGEVLQIGHWNEGTTTWTDRLLMDSNGHFYFGADNSQSVGIASRRASVFYAGTGTINTSDEREKVWRGAMNDAELRAARRMIDELGFFQWKDAIEEKGDDGARYHFGPRAQRVWAIMADEGLVDPIGKDGRPGKTPYAFLCFDEWPDEYEDEMKPVIRRKKVPAEEASVILDPKGGRVKKTKMVTVEVEEMAPTGRKLLKQAAGNRFGLRVDQLALFLMAAQAHDLAAERARNDAIEARLAALEAA